jgi:hypothetical protein
VGAQQSKTVLLQGSNVGRIVVRIDPDAVVESA